jgi:hypothetical protein
MATAGLAHDDPDKLRGGTLVDKSNGGGNDSRLDIRTLLPCEFTVLCIYAKS